ncbi:MAG: peptidyl-tRNA hydrolase Pth2 [Thermoplasmata archaeon]|nr:peptidyl-tRNA hydrolase Pth2 [Thermoplasmata archaeon]
MVLVVRGELRLTAGKTAVQVAHAAVMLVEAGRKRNADALAAWFAQGQRKIAVVVPTIDDLERVQRLARAKGLMTEVVEDAGLTEVPPGTKTVLGIGPARAEEIDAITGNLPLL